MVQACNKIIEYSFYLLFTLIPLILTPWNYELFEFNKMMLTYFLTVIIVAAWLTRCNLVKRFVFRRTPLDKVIALFFVSQLISTIFSIDRHTSLFGYYSRFNGGLLSTISYILLYYAFVSNMTRRRTLLAIRYSLFAATLVASYGIAEHFGIDAKYWVQDVKNRVFSTLGQPNWLATYLIALIPLTWGFALSNSKLKIKNSISYWLFAICYLCLLYTKSRSGLLGFAVTYLVFWILSFLKEKKKNGLKFFFFSFSILILSLLVGTPWTPNIKSFQTNKYSQAPSPKPQASQLGGTPSSEIRRIVWRGAIEISRHHPILGTGPETFAQSYYWYRPREHNDVSEWDFLYNKAHNEYLNYLANTGIVGLGGYLLLIGSFLGISIKYLVFSKKSLDTSSYILNTSLLAGYTGLLVSNFFGFSVVITNLFLFLFPAMAFVLTSKPQNLTPLRCKPTYTLGIKQWLTIALILFSIFYFLFFICRFWYADYLFAQGKKYIKAEAPLKAFNYLEKAASLNHEPFFYNELSNSASILALNLHEQKETTVAAQLADFSLKQSDKTLSISPYHLNYWKTRAKMFYNLAQIDEKYYQNALETLIHASELAPTDAKVFYNLGVLYYYLGQENEAIKTMEKTVKLKPNYEAAKKQLEGWYNE